MLWGEQIRWGPERKQGDQLRGRCIGPGERWCGPQWWERRWGSTLLYWKHLGDRSNRTWWQIRPGDKGVVKGERECGVRDDSYVSDLTNSIVGGVISWSWDHWKRIRFSGGNHGLGFGPADLEVFYSPLSPPLPPSPPLFKHHIINKAFSLHPT